MDELELAVDGGDAELTGGVSVAGNPLHLGELPRFAAPAARAPLRPKHAPRAHVKDAHAASWMTASPLRQTDKIAPR